MPFFFYSFTCVHYSTASKMQEHRKKQKIYFQTAKNERALKLNNTIKRKDTKKAKQTERIIKSSTKIKNTNKFVH